MRRNGIAALLSGTALSASVLVLLVGCSLLPSLPDEATLNDDDDDREDSSEVVGLSADDLEDLLDSVDVPSAFDFDVDFDTIDSDDRVSEIEDYWGDSGVGDDCYDSYAASYIVGDDNDDDEFADLASQESDDGDELYSYASIDARAFADPDDAADFLDVVRDAAEECSDGGGYQLVDELEEVVWEVTRVDIDDVDFDLPDGVDALYQEEIVDADFADSYRVTFLQYGNVVVALTIQPSPESSFDLDDGDELAEALAEALTDLD